MIAEVIQYGGAIYWLLLLFFCIVTSHYAEKRIALTTPVLWGLATIFYVFGFTTIQPDWTEVGMFAVAYLLFGVIFTISKWCNLVYRVRYFVRTVKPYVYNDYDLRHLTHEAFRPMDAVDVMSLPPDPYEFRTRLTAWWLFWPSFTLFRCFSHAFRWASKKLWTFFHDLSTRLYER